MRVSVAATRQTAHPPVGSAKSLRIEDVSHSFGGWITLDRVTFGVEPGILTSWRGPNGSGKTTLMRVMLGMLAADRGEVRYGGQRVKPNQRSRWGYIPQERGLYPAVPACDQVTYFGRLHGLPRQEATAKAHPLLDEVD
jgi:ABC-2 type transport system ATP-binding protein